MPRQPACKPCGGKPCGPHRYKRLNQKTLKKLGPGRHADGEGLYLVVRTSGKRYWVQRVVIHKRRRDLGLGSADKVPLMQARGKAYDNRRIAREGRNPLPDAAREKGPTFREVWEKVVANRALNWKTPATFRTWSRDFENHVHPAIGHLRVAEITLQHVEAILQPHWKGRGSKGYLLRQNLEAVFDYAVACDYRPDNPAAKVKAILRPVRKEVKHQPSLPYRQAPQAFADWQSLPLEPSIKWLLVFVVLTAARFSQAAKAKWSEFHLSEKLWRVPSEHMKARKAHDVPLSDQVVEILKRMTALKTGNDSLVFPIVEPTGVSKSVEAGMLLRTLQKLKRVDVDGRPIVTHGFRATFRVWSIEQARAPREVCEAALAHGESDKTVAAYTDQANPIDDRAELMQAWADFLLGQSWRVME